MSNPNKVTIELDLTSYNTLKKWASVSRTIDASIELLGAIEERGNIDVEHINYNMDELIDLRQALDNCNAACKEHYMKTGI